MNGPWCRDLQQEGRRKGNPGVQRHGRVRNCDACKGPPSSRHCSSGAMGMSSLLDGGLSKVRLVVRSLKDGQSKLDFHLIKQQEYGWDSGRVVVVHLIVFCFFAN